MSNAARSLSSWLVHAVLPDVLSSATMAAFGPPGVTITRSPSTSGDSLINQPGFRPSKSCRILRRQTFAPSRVRRQASSPFSASAYRRSPSSVGVPRGPLPRSCSILAGKSRGPRRFPVTAIQAENGALPPLHALHVNAIVRDRKRPVPFAQTGNGPGRRRPVRRPRLRQAGFARNTGAVWPAPLGPFGRAVGGAPQYRRGEQR